MSERELDRLRARLAVVERERDELKRADVDPGDRAWFNRMLEETEHDVWIGLDHSLHDAPGRIRCAKDAFDRLVRTTKRFAYLAISAGERAAMVERERDALREVLAKIRYRSFAGPIGSTIRCAACLRPHGEPCAEDCAFAALLKEKA